MKIIRIFEIRKISLYSMQFDTANSDEFSLAFNHWNDVEYLFNSMNNRAHLIELRKLELAKNYLKENGVFEEDDYELLEL